jgi:hypothetical protein
MAIAIVDPLKQELPLLTCIIAIIQKEERPDSRNRQAAENDRRQNEDQIWQRGLAVQSARQPPTTVGVLIGSLFM